MRINMFKLTNRRITAVLTVVLLIFALLFSFVFPQKVKAETYPMPGTDLIVRVGYFGDDDDYREKARLTNRQLQSLNQQMNYYTNVTRVGTIMYMAAQGPTIEDVLEEAGIDINSVQMIHLRTSDMHNEKNSWYGSFPAKSYLKETRYYYPAINGKWVRDNDTNTGTPGTGALAGAKGVDTILAIKSKSTKNPAEAINMSNLKARMNTEYSYRMCAGQKTLTENVKTTAAQITANETAYKIFGIDVQLYGSPPSGKVKMGIRINLKKVKVGSTQNLSTVLKGKDFFGDDIKGTVKWASDNEKVATVGEDSGKLTILSEGTAKITATLTATTGEIKKASVTINTKNTGKKSDKGGGGSSINGANLGDSGSKSNNGESGTGKGVGLTCREVSINMENDVVYDRNEMSDDAIALAKQQNDPKVMLWAGIIAAVLMAAGIVYRIRRFHNDIDD